VPSQGKREEQAWYKAYIQLAKEAFQRAGALLPDEWLFQVFLGKFRRKQGMPASKVVLLFVINGHCDEPRSSVSVPQSFFQYCEWFLMYIALFKHTCFRSEPGLKGFPLFCWY
jgi:hypothetical protein